MGVGREFEGRDVGEAIQTAAGALGVPASGIRYEVVEEGRRGLFGLGGRRVRIWVELPPEQASRHDVEVMPPARQVSDEQRSLEDTLHRMLRMIGLDVKMRCADQESGVRIDLDGPDRRLLLQKEGELLAALQFVLNRMARRAWPGVGHVQLECNGYRSRQEQDLVDMARETARSVARTGRPRRLHAMNPYERRVVHVTVREIPGVTSHSEGDGFLKQITVAPEE